MRLEKIRNDILREMYSEAEPGLDFDHLLKNPDEYDEKWFENHHLPKGKQDEIFEKHCEKHDVTGSERSSLSWTCFLDLGPRYTEKEVQDEELVDNE